MSEEIEMIEEVEHLQGEVQEEVQHECDEDCDDPCALKPKRKYVRKDPSKKIKRKRSAEHNAKIAAALRGRNLDPSHREAIAQSMIGNQNRSKS